MMSYVIELKLFYMIHPAAPAYTIKGTGKKRIPSLT